MQLFLSLLLFKTAFYIHITNINFCKRKMLIPNITRNCTLLEEMHWVICALPFAGYCVCLLDMWLLE